MPPYSLKLVCRGDECRVQSKVTKKFLSKRSLSRETALAQMRAVMASSRRRSGSMRLDKKISAKSKRTKSRSRPPKKSARAQN
jgi:hypothetical protein